MMIKRTMVVTQTQGPPPNERGGPDPTWRMQVCSNSVFREWLRRLPLSYACRSLPAEQINSIDIVYTKDAVIAEMEHEPPSETTHLGISKDTFNVVHEWTAFSCQVDGRQIKNRQTDMASPCNCRRPARFVEFGCLVERGLNCIAEVFGAPMCMHMPHQWCAFFAFFVDIEIYYFNCKQTKHVSPSI